MIKSVTVYHNYEFDKRRAAKLCVPAGLSVHPLDGSTGAIGTPKRLAVGKNPNWIEIVDLP